MESEKKGHNELCKTDTDSQTLKNMVSKADRLGGCGDELVVWNGNAIKLGCDDHCMTINVIKFILKIYRFNTFSVKIPMAFPPPRNRTICPKIYIESQNILNS